MTRFRTIALGTAVAAAALFALAGPASAHVTVSAPGASQGGSDQEITFRVPVEENADTVGLKLALPTDTPIASVDVQAMPGWTHTQKTAKLAKPIHTDDGDITQAVSEIDWAAQRGQGLKPGEFGAFTIIAGQLPDTPTLTFKAIQTYANGTSVSWIEVAAPGAAEPDHPAPTLQLAKTVTAADPSATATAASAAPATSKSSDTGPVVLSIVALVVAAAALGLGIRGRAGRERA